MINHFWTLLLNKSGANLLVDLPGSEFVDPDFVEVDLPSYLKQIRSLLFGPSPDYYGMIFRGQQFLRLLNAFGWQEELTRYDGRTSYVRPELASGTFFQAPEYRVSNYLDAFHWQNRIYTDDRTNRLRWQWTVTAEGGNIMRIAAAHDPSLTTYQDYTVDGDLTSTLTLPGVGSTFVVNAPETGVQWLVEASLQPAVPIVSVAGSVVDLPQDTVRQLCDPIDAEPGQTFYNVWSTHPETLNRLAAVVAAVVYRTEQLRTKND